MKTILITALLFITTLAVQAQQERKFIRSGNSQFDEEKYLESEIEYRKALDKDKNSFEAQFNLGDALFKQEKFDEAIDQFNMLAGMEQTPENLAKVYHNLGNSYFVSQKFPESIAAYKNALRNNPADDETRYNLIAAQKMLQQQQQQQDQNKDQNKDQQDKDQQQDQKPQDSDGDGIPDEKEQQNEQGQPDKNTGYRSGWSTGLQRSGFR